MACHNRSEVYLGYVDEYVTDEYRDSIDFKTSKIGGRAKCLEKRPQLTQACLSCGRSQLLVLQLYAPLENSIYHRTLYIFACINPECWKYNCSWSCLRVQELKDETDTTTVNNGTNTVPSATSWLAEADDWDNDMNDNASEQNENNLPANSFPMQRTLDDVTNNTFSMLSLQDSNTSSPASIESPIDGGAGGTLESPQAYAEIDGDESEFVSVDNEIQLKSGVLDMLYDKTPCPTDYALHNEQYSFVEKFLAIDVEDCSSNVPQHVHDLLREYQRKCPNPLTDSPPESGNGKSKEKDLEKYEKGIPIHGDKMFHNFVSRIQKNPGQILRYSRDNSAPLLLYPIDEPIPKCMSCGSESIFELQILPTIIPELTLLEQNNFQLEFGTILIYTCAKSCWNDHRLYMEERAIVQVEKLE